MLHSSHQDFISSRLRTLPQILQPGGAPPLAPLFPLSYKKLKNKRRVSDPERVHPSERPSELWTATHTRAQPLHARPVQKYQPLSGLPECRQASRLSAPTQQSSLKRLSPREFTSGEDFSMSLPP